MENMQYAEELIREFLVFRGFTNTLQAFEMELGTDIGKSFQVDKILDLIFSVYIPKFHAEKLVGLLSFFKQCFSSSTEIALIATLLKLEVSILRYYVVYALQSGRKDKVVEFFGMNGNDLLQRSTEWTPWFAIPYLKNPSLDPQFRIYFSKEWHEALCLSARNFFSEIFNGTRIPALLKISSEKKTVNCLKKDAEQLNQKLSQLQTLLEEKEAQLCQMRMKTSSAASVMDTRLLKSKNSMSSNGLRKEDLHLTSIQQDCSPATPNLGGIKLDPEQAYGGQFETISGSIISESAHDSMSLSTLYVEGGVSAGNTQVLQEDSCDENGRDMPGEAFPEVKVNFQETFLGHTSSISRCRFSASGNNIASASIDGTVRIWTYEPSTPASRNATIYCGAEIMSLDWDLKSDRLLLIGTADGGIKAWNVDAKRVVCDLNTGEAFPRNGSSYIDSLGFASLTVWNMKTWKAMTVLPLGEDPPAITSLCFNHNGKILAASATDGMIHMFDMSAGLQITGWPAHDSAISSILFGTDETSIFSLGLDGKVFEWSLQNPGQVLWSRDCQRFFDPKASRHCRHEMALDAHGRRLLVTSSSVKAPIYQVRGPLEGMKTLAHNAAITTVDWHPTLPIFLTGSADHSVRVSSIP
ncbi:WD repeat-containing protein 91 homolog isoform X2 [Tripterygium wilfordii]|uniref:WD repeat-containing protein 91 homolog isoform X2 n=1 Tax=Tripterygium wilfordii TaxID=458696 RepID=UPI0018F7FAC3|nr:WD repeat-containing protein 91 homolog isoform X2 [Tripterygium wilfordii]